jgi:hypothetical protein
MQAGIPARWPEVVESLSASPLFRMISSHLIGTPIYMVSRRYRGGEFHDTPDARDVALGLVPYGFARGGMTRYFVGDPALHEIDLVVVAEEAGVEVLNVTAPWLPFNYTLIDHPVRLDAYAHSGRIHWDDPMAFYKDAARRHAQERYLKQQLFGAVREMEQASTPEAALRAIETIRSVSTSLRASANQPPTPHQGYVYGSWTNEFFDDLIGLARSENIKEAYERLLASKTMRVLRRERQVMTDTYEDDGSSDERGRGGRLQVPPLRRAA